MNEPRYEELLGRVLDDEFSPADLEQLSEALRGEPDRVADFQFHLVLWELFSQQRRRERGAEAFVASWHTRLAAETQAAIFVEQTIERLETSGVSQPATLSPMPPLNAAPAGQIRSGPGLSELLRLAWGRLNVSALAFATCVALVVGLGIWYFDPTVGQPALAEIHGVGMSLERAGQLIPVSDGMRLQAGDLLRTPDNSAAAISFAPEKTRILLNPSSEFKLAAGSRSKRYELRSGQIAASVARQRPFQPMVIVTPQAEARVLGTRFTLVVSTNGTRLDVVEGKVGFTRLKDLQALRVRGGHYAVAASRYELAALPQTGGISREFWNDFAGKNLVELQQNGSLKTFSGRSELAQRFELPLVQTNRLLVRFRGYLHPPISGDYEFWLAGAPEAKLYMSSDDRPSNRVLIAQSTHNRNWDAQRFRGPSNWSSPLPLVAGHRYYVEGLLLIPNGEGYLSVAWKRPGATRELLTGEFLSPMGPKE